MDPFFNLWSVNIMVSLIYRNVIKKLKRQMAAVAITDNQLTEKEEEESSVALPPVK